MEFKEFCPASSQVTQVKVSKALEPFAGQRRPDRCPLAWERLNFAQTTADPRRLPVQSPDTVGRRRGPCKPFSDRNEDVGRFPWASGLPPGYDAVRASVGCGQQALAGLREEIDGGWGWARRQHPGRGGASRSPRRVTPRGFREKPRRRHPRWGLLRPSPDVRDGAAHTTEQARRSNPILSAPSLSISKAG